ncbi:MAG TPA: CARDB domain-containing protein, partial [Planctomycetota bacterium]|nr:CARDB domain-containing protein [Planctomycetota bacterium]
TSRCAGAGAGLRAVLVAVFLAVFFGGTALPAVLPDLTDGGGGFFSPTGISGNQTFTIFTRVQNLGTTSGTFFIKYYASLDTNITTGDKVIGGLQVSAVPSFGTIDCPWTGTFPTSISNGSYYVGWIIDALSQVGESNESNNVYCLPQPKLMVVPNKTRVFNPNPVNALNNPSLRDDNDSNDAVPLNGYDDTVTLDRLDPKSGGVYTLKGAFVQMVDIEWPDNTIPTSSTTTFSFLRDDPGFEEVMCYYHITEAQKHVQSLGFTKVCNRKIDVDAHGVFGMANSWYSLDDTHPFGQGYIAFGGGDWGVDHGEDADVILHEYGHAMQDNQRPGLFFGEGDAGYGNETGAMTEGFADYWAASRTYSLSVAHGFNPAIMGEWAGVTMGGIRRLDSTKRYPQSMVDEVHDDGEIWSTALYRIMLATGSAVSDKIIIHSHTLLPTDPLFIEGANAIMSADKSLFGGSHAGVIVSAFTRAGIFALDLKDENEPARSFSPTTISAGNPFRITCSIRNADATVESGSFLVRFYASVDTSITTADYLIGEHTMGSIPANGSGSLDWTGTFPETVPKGSYWVGWIIDADNQLAETNEDNNTAYKTSYKLTVQDPPLIDVTPASLAFSTTGVGKTADLAFTVSNAGTGTLAGSATGLTPPFSFVGGSTYSVLPGQSKTITVRFAPTTSGSFSGTASFSGGGGATRPVSGDAVFTTSTLSVQSAGASGVSITGTPAGTTNYSAGVIDTSMVNLTAPAQASSLYFLRWKDPADSTLGYGLTLTFVMNGNATVIAEYGPVTSFYVNDATAEPGFAAGDNTNTGTSAQAPMASLQALLDRYPAIGTGCTVMVSKCTLMEKITFNASHSGLTIQGAGPGNSIINANQTGLCLILIQVPSATLSGFSLRNGSGIVGGAVYCDRSTLALRNCLIVKNAANNGAGVYCSNATLSVSNCTFGSNTAYNAGGGLCADSSGVTIENSIFWGNTGPIGPEITARSSAVITARYCNASSGGVAAQSATMNWDDGQGDAIGNTTVDPLFNNAAGLDFHVKSKYGRYDPSSGSWVIDPTTSPCIDAGDPAAACSNEPQPNYGRVNMGAFGNTSEASKSPWTIPGDCTGDCRVNILDLIFIRGRLNQSPSTGDNWKADVNDDGKVNILDLIFVRGKLNSMCR